MPPPYPLAGFECDFRSARRRAGASRQARRIRDRMCFSRPPAYLWRRMKRRYRLKRGANRRRVPRSVRAIWSDARRQQFVRKHLGIELEDLAFDEWWMVVDTLTSEPAKRPRRVFQYAGRHAPERSCRSPQSAAMGNQAAAGEDPGTRRRAGQRLKLLKGFTDTPTLRSGGPRLSLHALLGQGCAIGVCS